MEDHLEKSLETIDIAQFKLQSQTIRPAFEFKKKHDPAFKNMTSCSFANKIGIGESTWKKLYSGQSVDAMCSTIWAIAKSLGLDVAILFGLAPMRDYAREEQVYNPTLMDNLRRQNLAYEEAIRYKDMRIEDLEKQLDAALKEQDRLRKLYHQEGIVRSRAEEQVKSLEEMVITRDKSIAKHDEVRTTNIGVINHLTTLNKRNRMISVIMSFVAVIMAGIMIYFLWELQNPHAGNWQF